MPAARTPRPPGPGALLLAALLLGGAPLQAGALIPDARRLAVEALPLLGTLTEGPTPVLLRGRQGRQRAAPLLDLARAVYRDVNRRFVTRRGAAAPVDLCLFSSDDEYEDFVLRVFGKGDHSPLGFYAPDRRLVVVNLARGVGNLRHELVHPLLGDDFPAIPAWLTEGVAALYGSSVPRPRGFHFLVNYRLRDLQAALRRGDLPTLEALTRSGHDEVRGERASTYYALARYVLLYAERRGQLDGLYASLRNANDAGRQLAALRQRVDEPGFRRWAAVLRR